jgi:long-chain acyl-CoA synthetase
VFLDAQGSSEVGTPSVIRYVTPFTRRFDRRVGRPGSTPFGPKTRVTTREGSPARRGEVGRLEVKGKTIFAGYWNNHALTYAAMNDGWFFTGDVVRRGPDGHLIQLDREVDVIHTLNGAVYTLPIEEVVHKHPMVFDVCVYGARQSDGTQLPVAAIALRAGFVASSNQLLNDINAGLTERDRLHRVDIMKWEAFPIGITGKTLKRVFRERTELAEVFEQNRPVSFTSLREPTPMLSMRAAGGRS